MRATVPLMSETAPGARVCMMPLESTEATTATTSGAWRSCSGEASDPTSDTPPTQLHHPRRRHVAESEASFISSLNSTASRAPRASASASRLRKAAVSPGPSENHGLRKLLSAHPLPCGFHTCRDDGSRP